MLINDEKFPYYGIVNELDRYFTTVFASRLKLLKFEYSNSHSSAGYGWFFVQYQYDIEGYIIQIEHEMLHVVIRIIDPRIPEDDKTYHNYNSLVFIYQQVKRQIVDTNLTIEAIKKQIDYLYNILVKKDPQFFPVKRNIKAKNRIGKKYWEIYWEEHP